ncbi:MAG: hypothetical protein V3V97_05900, partial [Hyphomicrobiaceae bacterium]
MAREQKSAPGDDDGQTATSGVTLQDDNDEPVRRVGRRRAAGPARGRVAANDDVPSIGGLLFALNQQPSKRPFFYAAVATGVWALVGGVLGIAFIGDELQRLPSMAALLGRPATIAVATAVLAPISLFWFLAVLIWRAQELKLMSSAMTEVAVRLAEPDRLAEQSVASLGQTVRRQVSAMNDAIARALGRAGELEALVHNEVAALERSYSDNELRVRSLIEELASERDALANNSDRVSEVLRGIGAQVSRDIASASDQAARNLTDATSNLSIEIESAGQQLTTALKEASDQTAHVVSEKGNTLLASLGDINERIAMEVPTLLDKLSGEQTRLTKIVEGAGRNLAALETALAQRTGSLETTLGQGTQELQGVLENYSELVETSMTERSQALETTLVEQNQSLNETFGKRLVELESTISNKARALDAAIGEKMEHFDSSLTEKAKMFYQSINQAGSEMESTIVERTKAIDEAFNQKTDALRAVMQNHADAIRNSLERQSGDLDQALLQGIRAVQESNENISAQSIRTIEGLAGQSAVLKDVSQGILAQIHELTNRFENQGQAITKAAHALESSNFRIDSTLEARHGELSDLLAAIAERAESFDGMMSSYSTSLDESLNRIEDKALAVTRSVTKDTQQTSMAAMAELNKLRTVTEVEAEKTLADLRSRFTYVSKEVSDRLSELSGKVATTTEDVRVRTEMAASALEDMRERLQSQAHDLPDAARASTDAMRQAVENQIKALETLANYTDQHVSTQDVAPPYIDDHGTGRSNGLGGNGAAGSEHPPPVHQSIPSGRGLLLSERADAGRDPAPHEATVQRRTATDPMVANIASHLAEQSRIASKAP